jgi:DNA-binding SARP family transcriptional activator
MNTPAFQLQALLLGRPVLRVNGAAVEVRTRKGIGLVAYLALEGLTRRGKLADLLWGDLDDEGARRNLRRELHRLRETPLGTHLEGDQDTLELCGRVDLDVTHFRALVESGDLEGALRVYRGPFLDGLESGEQTAFDAWLETTRRNLAEMRRSLLTRQADALEARGALREALELHHELLREDALQEAHHRAAMRLHALLGEREAALEQFEHLKTVLHDELSLEPLPETLSLASRIRAAESLEIEPRFMPGSAPRLAPPMIGRDAMLRQLENTGPGLTLIVGEPGVGKTRLLEEFMRAHPEAMLIRAHDEAMGTPFVPIAEVLRQAFTGGRLTWLEPVWRREAARLVPELDPDTEFAAIAPSPEGRARFLEGVTRALVIAAGVHGSEEKNPSQVRMPPHLNDGFVPGTASSESNSTVGDVKLFIFDDLHWLDASSSEVLTRLARRNDVRVIACARPPELQDNPAVSIVLESLERDRKIEHIELNALSELEVLTLVRTLSGGSGAVQFSRRLFDTTAGNPLYVLETIRHLFDTGVLNTDPHGGWRTVFDETTTDYTELPIPESVNRAVLARVDRLGAAPRRLLEAASLAAEPFSFAELEGATALSGWESVEALERALEANLIVSAPPGYRFSHDLVRRAVADRLQLERRRLLHRRLAERLMIQGGPPAMIATHLEKADQPREAAPWRVRAAEAASRLYAHAEVLEQYACALEDGVGQHDAFEIRRKRARTFWFLADLESQGHELNALDTLAKQLNDAEYTARAWLDRAVLVMYQGQYQEVVRLCDQVLEQPALSDEMRSETLYTRGAALVHLGRLPEGELALTQALALTDSGNRALIGRIRHTLCRCALMRGDQVSAREHNRAALEAFEGTTERLETANALMTSGILAMLGGDRGTARNRFEAALEEAQRIGHVGLQRTVLLNLARILIETRRLQEAQDALETGLNLTLPKQDPVQDGVFLSTLAQVQKLRGTLGLALESMRAAVELAERIGTAQQKGFRYVSLVDLQIVCGDFGGATTTLGTAQALIETARLDELRVWLDIQHAELELAQHQPQAVLDRLNRFLETNASGDAEARANIAWLRGAARAALGNAAGALEAVLDLETPAQTSSVWQARRLALQLEAGQDVMKTARSLLASGTVSLLESLDLRRALIHRLAQGKPTKSLLEQRRQAADVVRQLAASLEPDLHARNGFLARHADLLENAS